MTVFEPDKATWQGDGGMLVEASAITGEIRLRWSMGSRPAHRLNDMTMTADQAEQAELMLINARLWLLKSVAQHAEVAAADQLGDDVDPVQPIDTGGVRVICGCKHLAESHCEYALPIMPGSLCSSGHGCHVTGCRCTLSIWQVLRGRPWRGVVRDTTQADQLVHPGTVRYYPIPTETTTGRNPR